MLSDKEKLEEELRFLKESFEIGVITEEEFEQGKKRIEKKISDIDSGSDPKDISVTEIKHEDLKDKPELAPEKEEVVTSDTSTEKKPEEPVAVEQEKTEPIPVEEPKKEEVTESQSTDKKEEETREGKNEDEEKEEAVNGIATHEALPDPKDEEESGIGMWIGIVVAVLLIGILGFWFFSQSPAETPTTPEETIFEPVIACSSNLDCVAEPNGRCESPGTEDSECVYPEDIEVSVKVLSAEACTTCDTARVLSILRQFFPNLIVEEIPSESVSGDALITQFDIDALPAYVFDSDIQDAERYSEFKSSLREVKGSYVLKNTVANANFFVDRDEEPLHLDLFVKPNEQVSDVAEKNLEEFLESFGSEVIFVKHRDDSALAEDLDINTFPAFVVNNRLKFGGAQSADTIREYYCSMNDVSACNQELTQRLV